MKKKDQSVARKIEAKIRRLDSGHQAQSLQLWLVLFASPHKHQ